MARRGWIIVGVISVLVVALGLVGVLTLSGQQQVVATGTSPDGTWSVAVIGKPQLGGSYEVVVEVRDAQGQVMPGSFVVDQTSNLARAERDHAVSFIDNTTAKVGSRTLKKAQFIRE